MNGYQRNRDCCCERCSRGRIIGGAVLLTLGGLFLLKEFTHIGFQWPVLLIVIGVVMVWLHAGSTEGHVPPSKGTLDAPTPPPPPAQTPEPPQVPHV